MDSHRFGLDGIRLRCGAFRAVPRTTSNCPARSFGAALRSVAVVWNRTYRSWRSSESIFWLAPSSTGPGYGSGTSDAPSHDDSGRGYIAVPGSSWARNGDLSD